jgi:ribonuclease M5
MSNKIKELIVVEGKSDIDFLSSFLDADFYQVHGSAISIDDIVFLKKANETRGIIILTDPDFPGLKIRNTILKEIPNSKQAFVRKEVSIKHHKVGVAESTKDEVKNALKNVITFSEKPINNYKSSDLYDLGLIGSTDSNGKRKYLCEKLNIGYSNGKELLLKLNSLTISLDEIKEILKNVN